MTSARSSEEVEPFAFVNQAGHPVIVVLILMTVTLIRVCTATAVLTSSKVIHVTARKDFKVTSAMKVKCI